jgi:hypothetical protein
VNCEHSIFSQTDTGCPGWFLACRMRGGLRSSFEGDHIQSARCPGRRTLRPTRTNRAAWRFELRPSRAPRHLGVGHV